MLKLQNNALLFLVVFQGTIILYSFVTRHQQIDLNITSQSFKYVYVTSTKDIDPCNKFNWNCTRTMVDSRTSTLERLDFLGWKYRQLSHEVTDNPINPVSQTLVVPSVIHYVWFGTDLKFQFVHFITFLSVHKRLRPHCILMYGEVGPSGYWWNRTVEAVKNIYLVIRKAPTYALNGAKIRFEAHKADMLRVEVVLKLGGIYFDADVIVLKSLDSLRQYETTMGREGDNTLCNGAIIAAQYSPFLSLLYDAYHNYDEKNEPWDHLAVKYPHKLSTKYPHLIHIEERSLHRPNWQAKDMSLIYNSTWDWSKNYAMHLWIRSRKNYGYPLPTSEAQLDCLDTTLGEMFRYTLYDKKNLRCDKRS